MLRYSNMKISQTQKMSQKLLLTPQMRQSLYILQLPIIELKDHVQKEIEENPILENLVTKKDESISDRIDFENSLSDNMYQNYPSGDYANELSKKRDYKESLIVKEVSLHEVLLKQLHTSHISRKDQLIGEFIIHHIDDNGYLTLSLNEIVDFLNKNTNSSEEELTKDKVKEILATIQTFEPVGVGAKNLKECLILQLKAQNKLNTLVHKIILNHLSDVAKNRIRLISKKLKVKPEKIKKAIKEISSLEPKPGGRYASDNTVTVGSSYPDIILEKTSSGYEIIVTTYNMPKFRVSQRYKNILKSNDVTKDTKTYVRQKLKAALSLEKSISLRDETLKGLAKSLLKIQKDFFEHGDIDMLKPLTYRRVAQMISRNESTVSRVVNSKYMKTSHGIFKLSYFFTKPIKVNNNSETVSRELIKSKIFNIISEESKKKPLNDSRIACLLEKEGTSIARRTVAKYREELKINTASLRKQSKK